MTKNIHSGDCIRIPDGRIGRVRDVVKGVYRVRIGRKTSKSHQFLKFRKEELKRVDYPKGWMSSEGYNRYLKVTLEKMRKRIRKAKS